MRKIIFTLLAALCMNFAHAQDTTHTLLKWKRPEYLGIYVAPEFHYGQLNGAFTAMGGSSVMLLLNKRWGIGVTGQMTLDRRFSPSGVAPLYLRAGFGGLKLEYTANPNGAIHFTFPLTLGMGFAQADSIDTYRNRNDDFGFGRNFNRGNQFAVIQPGVQVEANLVRFVKLFAGVNYRIAFKTNSVATTLPTNTLQGLSFNVGAKFGLFDFYVRPKKASSNM